MNEFLGKYKKILGIFGLLVVVSGFTAAMAPSSFLRPENLQNTVRWTALFGIISVGVSFVIMTGGIDLSIGSVIGLGGCLIAMFLKTSYLPDQGLQVQRVDPTDRTLIVDSGGEQYAPGDRVRFLDGVYTIDSTASDRLEVREAIQTGEAVGSLQSIFDVLELSPEREEAVQHGTAARGVRTIRVEQWVTAEPGDRLSLVYSVGLPQEFTIHAIEAGEERSEIEFLVRRNQRLREPQMVTIAHRQQRMPTAAAIVLTLVISLGIGMMHGVLVAKVKLQPFVVTLCGLLIYRGVARFLTGDQEQGFGTEFPWLKQMAKGDFFHILTGQEFASDIPMPFFYLMVLSILAAIFLNKTIFGRYILALGRNEEAARYSGINTDAMVIVAYMICSFCAGVAAILFALDLNSIQPAGHGEFYELYAIAAAVLGGCSLRGGEGSILGVIIAAAVMRVLNNAINLIDGIDTSTEFAIIGIVILLGVIVDESVRRIAVRRRALAATKG